VTAFVDLITAFPAVVFTALLAFCVAWFLVTTVAGLGHDGHGHGHDGHGHADAHHGHGHADAHHGHGHTDGHHGHGHDHDHHGHDGHHGHDRPGLTTLPPALSLTMVSGVGWLLSVAATAGLRAADVDGPLLYALGAGVLAAAFYGGVLAGRPVARAMAPLFETQLAPSEDDVVGCHARVRSPELDDDDLGEPGRVVITTGPLKSAAFRAKAVPGRRFPLGADVFVVDAQRIEGRLVVYCDELHPELAP
jgi:hypothetical protein